MAIEGPIVRFRYVIEPYLAVAKRNREVCRGVKNVKSQDLTHCLDQKERRDGIIALKRDFSVFTSVDASMRVVLALPS
jgi:hypothetical protein